MQFLSFHFALLTNKKSKYLGQWPYLASIQMKKKCKGNKCAGRGQTFKHVCTGAIIGKLHILTAGSCLSKKPYKIPNKVLPAGKFRVVVGRNDMSERNPPDNNVYKVKSVHVHDDFYGKKADWVNDVGILVLKNKLKMVQL